MIKSLTVKKFGGDVSLHIVFSDRSLFEKYVKLKPEMTNFADGLFTHYQIKIQKSDQITMLLDGLKNLVSDDAYSSQLISSARDTLRKIQESAAIQVSSSANAFSSNLTGVSPFIAHPATIPTPVFVTKNEAIRVANQPCQDVLIGDTVAPIPKDYIDELIRKHGLFTSEIRKFNNGLKHGSDLLAMKATAKKELETNTNRPDMADKYPGAESALRHYVNFLTELTEQKFVYDDSSEKKPQTRDPREVNVFIATDVLTQPELMDSLLSMTRKRVKLSPNPLDPNMHDLIKLQIKESAESEQLSEGNKVYTLITHDLLDKLERHPDQRAVYHVIMEIISYYTSNFVSRNADITSIDFKYYFNISKLETSYLDHNLKINISQLVNVELDKLLTILTREIGPDYFTLANNEITVSTPGILRGFFSSISQAINECVQILENFEKTLSLNFTDLIRAKNNFSKLLPELFEETYSKKNYQPKQLALLMTGLELIGKKQYIEAFKYLNFQYEYHVNTANLSLAYLCLKLETRHKSDTSKYQLAMYHLRNFIARSDLKPLFSHALANLSEAFPKSVDNILFLNQALILQFINDANKGFILPGDRDLLNLAGKQYCDCYHPAVASFLLRSPTFVKLLKQHYSDKELLIVIEDCLFFPEVPFIYGIPKEKPELVSDDTITTFKENLKERWQAKVPERLTKLVVQIENDYTFFPAKEPKQKAIVNISSSISKKIAKSLSAVLNPDEQLLSEPSVSSSVENFPKFSG